MYNCEKYIVDCLNSVFAQDFDSFEIIVIDDCSEDKSYEVAMQNFGHLDNVTILKHETNTGQWKSVEDGVKIACGKYIRILHADDVFMPNALKPLYEIAEHFNADVVHEIAKYGSKDEGGAIRNGSPVEVYVHDNSPVDKITLMPYDMNERVKDWFERGTFVDCMFNLFRREFLIENKIPYIESGGNFLFVFFWLMKAKVYVKIPYASYIYRANPTSVSNVKRNFNYVGEVIEDMIDVINVLDKYFEEEEFFKDKKYLRELIKIEATAVNDLHCLKRLRFYDSTKEAGGGYKKNFTKSSKAA